MQSSSVILIRALVMLACLVALPLWAVVGTPMPAFVRALVDRHLPGMSAQRPSAKVWNSATAEAPAVAVSAPPIAASPAETAGSQDPAAEAELPGLVAVQGSAEAVERGHTDPLTAMEFRLRALGATHYLLEKWGTDGSFYRFQCSMAISRNPQHYRHFEATGEAPAAAMAEVLTEVEAWRSLSPRGE